MYACKKKSVIWVLIIITKIVKGNSGASVEKDASIVTGQSKIKQSLHTEQWKFLQCVQ